MSDSVPPHRRQPTRLPRPWDSPGKNAGVGCHFLLQWVKVKSESEVAQSCLTFSDPMDCSLPGSSVHGIFQAKVLEWGAIGFSVPSYSIILMYVKLFAVDRTLFIDIIVSFTPWEIITSKIAYQKGRESFKLFNTISLKDKQQQPMFISHFTS